MMDAQFSLWLTGVVMLLGIVLIVSWIILPFAVFGLKSLLRDAIKQQQRTNELLEQWARERNGRT
jgi:hypothetical protein